MKSWPAGPRRTFLLLAACAIPLFLIVATTSKLFGRPSSYFPVALYTKSSPTQAPIAEATEFHILPWSPPVNDASPTALPFNPHLPHGGQNDAPEPEQWTFDAARDARDFGLSDEQCDAAFPDFYEEIDRAVELHRSLGNITIDDLDMSWRRDEMLRAMIFDRQLYIIDAKWSRHGFDLPRAIALLQSMYRAIIAYPGPLPNIEFTICLGDVAVFAPPPSNAPRQTSKHPTWVLTRRADGSDAQNWVIPDFGYWSWPLDVVGEYSQVRREISYVEEMIGGWAGKVPKAVWRGAAITNPLRKELLRVAEGKEWSDVREVTWDSMTDISEGTRRQSLTMPEHCQYEFVVHTEGHSYSGRGKYLLNCHSVSIIHDPEWIEPHTHLLVPEGTDQNFLPVDPNFTNLDNSIRSLLAHPHDAQRIADNAVATFRDRYLTPAAQACYWRRLFWGWSQVQDFVPEFYRTVKDRETGRVRRKGRGEPFESWISRGLRPKVELPEEKPADKPADKAEEKPVDKADEKPVENAEEKTAENPEEKVADKPAEEPKTPKGEKEGR
ncbi:hypothetical protein EJ06DRAFT_511716 [Trichodelitschia bisporula]|uniref:Glycosyl transferase CAP10 domain-containing protein n=1 Tax=Trichodelitschia bisporula TaxID=703511 RepID=A0A6G1HU27_9PEZI|nr:hypothetical protein EJ06DRAFT_511716 [Trichodelitschia bisporula]